MIFTLDIKNMIQEHMTELIFLKDFLLTLSEEECNKGIKEYSNGITIDVNKMQARCKCLLKEFLEPYIM